jgi:hypothetical protein
VPSGQRSLYARNFFAGLNGSLLDVARTEAQPQISTAQGRSSRGQPKPIILFSKSLVPPLWVLIRPTISVVVVVVVVVEVLEVVEVVVVEVLGVVC